MKLNIIKILIFIIFFNFSTTVSGKINNKIIVFVENEIITGFELKNKILTSLILSNEEVNQINIDKIKPQALETLINIKIKKIELSKHSFPNSDLKVGEYLNQFTKNDVNSLKEKFRMNGLSFELYVEEIEDELNWRELIFRKYNKKININESEIEAELKILIQNKKDIEEYKLSEIEIFSDNQESDKKKISDMKQQISEFGFENTAQRNSISISASNNGDLGWVRGDVLSKNIYNIIKEMSKGDISKPIKNANSILFLKLTDKKISKKEDMDIKKIKTNIIKRKENELYSLYSGSYLSKLKNSSLIQYK
jgi:peptidyl-prolyl cis-trans isomerase SurA